MASVLLAASILVAMSGMTWATVTTSPPPTLHPINQPVLLVVEASAKETYDDNIYTYEYGPRARRASWITQGQLKLGGKFHDAETGTWLPSYTWEGDEFHDTPEESFQKHTARLEFQGKNDDWSWQGDLIQCFTDGRDLSPTWTGPGGAPAVGAPEVRNRRKNFIFDHTASLTWRPGPWWSRASYRSQWHDFMTQYSDTKGYQNYVDRSDFSLGLDLGRAITPTWDLFSGVRIGTQNQGRLRGSREQYDNDYVRWVAGVQGDPLPWLHLDGELGPDFRHFRGTLPQGEKETRTEIYYRASVVVHLTTHDQLTLCAKEYLFPSSSGCGMMRETIGDGEFTHQFVWDPAEGPVLACAVGFKMHEDDFFPANRRDRVYAPRMEWKTAWKKPWNVRLGYEFTWSESGVPATEGREFSRNRVYLSLAWKY